MTQKYRKLAKQVARVGVIDVGSNSVRLVVFDGIARAPAYFFNEKVLCGLGRGLSGSGRLSPEGRQLAVEAISRFMHLTDGMNLNALVGIATAAVREAQDGPEFCEQIARETGLQLIVASGSEEAELAAQGVLLGFPQSQGLVCDIGGASMELSQITDGTISNCATSPLGPLKLGELGDDAEIDRFIKKHVKKLKAGLRRTGGTIYLVGGSWRALARLDMVRRDYPLHILHEYAVAPEEMIKTAAWVQEQDIEVLVPLVSTSRERLQLVPLAARVMQRLVKEFAPDEIVVSAYGLREGVLYRLMPDGFRTLDPLIAYCRHQEETGARFPGFGEALYEWVLPLFADMEAKKLRLVHAACLLHDVTWRAHPDYRAEMCFETVTRANIGGVTHEERLFLAVAMMSRYKNASEASVGIAALDLLDPQLHIEAQQLGRAIRLGAMISGAQPDLLEQTEISFEGEDLVLRAAQEAMHLVGGAVDKRLAALGSAIGRPVRVEPRTLSVLRKQKTVP